LLPVSLIPIAKLPPVLLIPVVHLEYLREFLKKSEMILRLFSGAWWKMIHEKSKKSHDTLTLIPITFKRGNIVTYLAHQLQILLD
jgi:hypothetical protein